MCRHGFSCAVLKVKKESVNKGRVFFSCPNGKENSCGYFKWVPGEEEGSVQPVNSFIPKPWKYKTKEQENYFKNCFDDLVHSFQDMNINSFGHSSFGLCLRGKIEIILDELQKNNVDIDIDMRTLSHHVNYLLDKHGSIYQSIVSRCLDLVTIFYEIDVINFGPAMAYLTLVYLTKVSEAEIRVAV